MNDLANQKIFSLNDLIEMGFITCKQLEDHIRYMQAKQFVYENFKGMV